ncbi:diguanylate phosphodiesterase [Babesia ovata]|uniref:Diguanylate phosphodiesterase n=1 Tax=Babesia ovata TaxID=189622 RepID=A0A2H6KE61_9APIC|nr:diguanylate phosphodiesterase [Babesia ovata]GBE61282.1 diguanylate phosphodiesterase [Babesia ovata]
MNAFKKVALLLAGFAALCFAEVYADEAKLDDSTPEEWVKTVTTSDDHLKTEVARLKKDEAYEKDTGLLASKVKIDAFDEAVKLFTAAKVKVDAAKKALDEKAKGTDNKAEIEAVIKTSNDTVELYNKAMLAHTEALFVVAKYYSTKTGRVASLKHLRALDKKLVSSFGAAVATVALLSTFVATI